MSNDGWDIFEACPKCGAAAKTPCITPKGNEAKVSHDTRPFHLNLQGLSTPTVSVGGGIIMPGRRSLRAK